MPIVESHYEKAPSLNKHRKLQLILSGNDNLDLHMGPLQELARELMDRDPARQGQPARDVGKADHSRQQRPVRRMTSNARKLEKRLNRTILDQARYCFFADYRSVLELKMGEYYM